MLAVPTLVQADVVTNLSILYTHTFIHIYEYNALHSVFNLEGGGFLSENRGGGVEGKRKVEEKGRESHLFQFV
jgi:hypothetical protein